VRKETVYAADGVRRGLRERFGRSKARARDAWQEGSDPINPTQFIPIQASRGRPHDAAALGS
jgi:hypothetical protein